MRQISLFLFIAFLLLNFTNAFAQKKESKLTKPKKVKSAMFEGTIQEKPWTKSTQSYCAQGSEYFVLIKENGEEIVLKNESSQEFSAYNGQKVLLEGRIETKTIKPSNNPMEQRPVTPSLGKEKVVDEGFTCTILVVTKIKNNK